jgi:hypothetical protein
VQLSIVSRFQAGRRENRGSIASGAEVYRSSIESRQAVGLVHFLKNGYWELAVSLDLKPPGYESDHLPPSGEEIKNA